MMIFCQIQSFSPTPFSSRDIGVYIYIYIYLWIYVYVPSRRNFLALSVPAFWSRSSLALNPKNGEVSRIGRLIPFGGDGGGNGGGNAGCGDSDGAGNQKVGERGGREIKKILFFLFWIKALLATTKAVAAGKQIIGATIHVGREIRCLPYAGFSLILKKC